MFVLFLYVCVCFVCFFFFSSRRRHTRCALVTGVQTCALPIFMQRSAHADRVVGMVLDAPVLDWSAVIAGQADRLHLGVLTPLVQRSEERRVGKECVSTCRSRWSPYH